jgi:hypothetical protein
MNLRDMARRLVAPGLAVVVVLATLGGADEVASLVLLAAIVATAVRLLEAVGRAAVDRSGRSPVVLSAAALVLLVAGAAARAPLVAFAAVACFVLEKLLETGTATIPEPAEVSEAPASRAA